MNSSGWEIIKNYFMICPEEIFFIQSKEIEETFPRRRALILDDSSHGKFMADLGRALGKLGLVNFLS